MSNKLLPYHIKKKYFGANKMVNLSTLIICRNYNSGAKIEKKREIIV